MTGFVFTSCTGIFYFDEHGKPIKQAPFTPKESLYYANKLKQGEYVPPELDLLRFKPLIFLGFKGEKRSGVKLSQDVRKLQLATQRLDTKRLKEVNSMISARDFFQGFSEDVVIIHLIRTYDELDNTINSLLMRVKDFTRLYAPEATGAAATVSEVLELVKKPIKPEELTFPVAQKHIEAFGRLAELIKGLEHQQVELEEHLKQTMKGVCANLLGVAGVLLGARLISIAGSLEQLAKMPYSKLQVLGAEKAMFRHVRSGTRTPKHGIILMHELVSNARDKGRAARVLAEKLSHAARIDFFHGTDISKKLLSDIKRKLQ